MYTFLTAFLDLRKENFVLHCNYGHDDFGIRLLRDTAMQVESQLMMPKAYIF